MSCTIIVQSEEAKDRAATLRNRARHGVNKNLLFWYRELYRDQLRDFSKPKPLSRVFRFGLLAPHPTCLLVGYRAGCRSLHFLYHTLFSTDLAISGRLPRFCAAFSPNPGATLMSTG